MECVIGTLVLCTRRPVQRPAASWRRVTWDRREPVGSDGELVGGAGSCQGVGER